jgi:secretion/DNA translocation related TadE-like protein
MKKDDTGSVSVVIAAVAAMVLVLVMGAVDVGKVLAARDRAQTAADAAALAAAQELAVTPGTDPSGVASRYAALNGAIVTAFTWTGSDAEVTVSEQVAGLLLGLGTRSVTASARAVVDLPPS